MTNQIKVLTIATTRFELDGITNSVMNYYRYMDKKNMQIDFVVPNKLPIRLKDEIENNKGHHFELLKRNKRPLTYYKKLKSIIRKGNYNIVHAHGNSCTLAVEMLAAKHGGAKVRISHSRNTMCKHKFIHSLLRPIFNRTYTHGFACGHEAGKWLFNNDDFTVLTNGNDVEKFRYSEKARRECRQKYNLENKKVIGHVGRFSYQKNHEFLIDVFEELTKISDQYILLLVGDGNLKKDIEMKVKNKKLNGKVILVGKSWEVEKLIQAMDIMVLPSRYEGLPNVLIEWQLAGLPSIVSDEVTKEAKVTELVQYLPLEIGAKKWAKKIDTIKLADRNNIEEQIVNEVTEAGFNVQENAVKLSEIYKDLIS